MNRKQPRAPSLDVYIKKTSITGGSPVVATAFDGLITGGHGPDSPRGVDNYDPNATEGYIIGQSDSAFGRLIVRRISNPGGTPSISANISITVDSTSFPVACGSNSENSCVQTIASSIGFDAAAR